MAEVVLQVDDDQRGAGLVDHERPGLGGKGHRTGGDGGPHEVHPPARGAPVVALGADPSVGRCQVGHGFGLS
jgi:hypothetical protein